VVAVVAAAMVVVVKSDNILNVRKQNIFIYKDTIYIRIRNVTVMVIIKSIY
jgi:hypothetical protein